MITLDDIKYIIKLTNSFGGIRKINYIFKKGKHYSLKMKNLIERREVFTDFKAYQVIYKRFTQLLKDQFD